MLADHLAFLPILMPLAGAGGAFLMRRHPRLRAMWSLAALVAALASSAALLAAVWVGGEAIVFRVGGWAAPFGIVLVGDLLAAAMVMAFQLVFVCGLLYVRGCRDRCAQFPQFDPLFLTLVAGLSGAVLTGDLFSLFVFAELVVFSGTVLTAIADDPLGVEAAYKYFFISLLASLSLLLAVGALYVSYGTLNLADLARRIADDPSRPLLGIAIACLTASFLIKSAVFPFHFWQPDFHSASPTAVSAMLSSVVVKLGVVGLLRMTTLLFVAQAVWLRPLLVGLGLVGIVFGGLSAIGSRHAKRMLAYSTLSQVGFILIGIGWGTPAALAAAIVFTLNHSLIKSAMLMLAGAVASRVVPKSAAFDAVAGVGRSLPLAGALFLLGGLGLAGIPPTNGFISKLAIFRSGLDAGATSALGLAAAASILTLIYATRAFQVIWWNPPAAASGSEGKAGDALLAPAILIGLCLAIGLWPEPLIRLAQDAAAWLLSPELYMRAVLGG